MEISKNEKYIDIITEFIQENRDVGVFSVKRIDVIRKLLPFQDKLKACCILSICLGITDTEYISLSYLSENVDLILYSLHPTKYLDNLNERLAWSLYYKNKKVD